jgi:hypothetical protein
MGKPLRDLSGQTFGKLSVVSRAESDKHGNARWLCRCECGNEKAVAAPQLVKGKTKSCGCSQGKKPQSAYGVRRGTRLYNAWKNMRRRCFEQSNKAFRNYGARGITVCERWADFELFAADMGHPPAGMSLDRIDNDGNYEPANCRWATKSEQNSNQRHDWRRGDGNPNSKKRRLG